MMQQCGGLWVAWLCAVCVAVVTPASDPTQGILYSSLTRMKMLFEFDEAVGDLVSLWPQPPAEAVRYLELYRRVVEDRARVGGVGVAGHPLHLYSLIKRLVRLWPPLKPHLEDLQRAEGEGVRETARREEDSEASGVEDAARRVLQMEKSTKMPTEADLSGASLALVRLQSIYLIPVADLMAARLTATHVPLSIRLSDEDCVEVAVAAYSSGNFAAAWHWLNSFLNTTTNRQFRQNMPKLLKEIETKHDQSWRSNDMNFLPQPLQQNQHQVPHVHFSSVYCRGQHQRVPSLLRCHVGNRGSHYLTLQPVCYEELHRDPDLTIFYNVISDAEIEELKEFASTRLKRSTLGVSNYHSEIRVSQTAWLRNSSLPVLPAINRRMEAITNLFLYEGKGHDRAGELLQVVNYGIGGHFNVHNDDFDDRDIAEEAPSNRKYTQLDGGNRLSTWMFYLSDVTAGGYTIFPQLNISITPLKGSAAFWYNLKKNGERDHRMMHGGCPVLLGQKWVANKWIREHKNFLRYPCSTNPHQ